MKKVAVWGKFDGLHQGHLEFLRRAKSLGNELYIIVIPDEKVLENSGRVPRKQAEERRKELMQLDFIKDVYIDSLSNGLHSILELKPDIFVFGYDQKTEWEKKLKHYLASYGLFPEYIYLDIYNNGVHSSDFRNK